jgi:hypothetical protein
VPNFHIVKDDEVVYPIMPGPYRMACCDCGLVHNWYFQIVRVLDKSKPTSEDIVVDDPQLKVRLTCERNNRSTAAMRREDRKRKASHDTAEEIPTENR